MLLRRLRLSAVASKKEAKFVLCFLKFLSKKLKRRKENHHFFDQALEKATKTLSKRISQIDQYLPTVGTSCFVFSTVNAFLLASLIQQ